MGNTLSGLWPFDSTLSSPIWQWQSNENPWDSSEAAKWTNYSDIQTLIIERDFQRKNKTVSLTKYTLDLEKNLQISKENCYNQRKIRRIVSSRPIRANRCIESEDGVKLSFKDPIFRKNNIMRGSYEGQPLEYLLTQSDKRGLLYSIVSNAAEGIRTVGYKLGKNDVADLIF